MSNPTVESVTDLIPASQVCLDILATAREALPAAIFNHSVRVYLLAKWLATQEKSSILDSPKNLDLLCAACLGHDLGASDLYNGKQRFEVEGADATCQHLQKHNIHPDDQHKIWTAIALHASPGIAERIDPFTRLVRVAVKIDFSRDIARKYGAEAYAMGIEQLLPRLEVEKVLSDAVVKQAEKIPERTDGQPWPPDSEKHPKASWSGILLRAHAENPGYEGVNPAF